MLSSSCKESPICQTKTKRKIERKLRVRAIQNAWNCNMYQYVPGIIFWVFTDSDESIWMIRSDELFWTSAKGWAKVHIFHQVLQVKCCGGTGDEAISANVSLRNKIRPLRVSTKRRRNLTALRDVTRKKMKSERRERKRKSFSGTHRSFTHPAGIFFSFAL